MPATFPPYLTPLKNEELICETRPSGLYFLGEIILCTVLLLVGGIGLVVGAASSESMPQGIGLVCAALGIPCCLWTAIRVLLFLASHRYVVTNLRVLSKKGLISIATSEVRVVDIRGANLHQSILGRIFGVGSIAIGSAATAGTELAFDGIRNPRHVLALINAQRTS